MADQLQNNISSNPANAVAGLNLVSLPGQHKPGQYSYALNSVIENFDGNQYSIQNEQGNEKCIDFPSGFIVIGQKSITNLNKVLYWLVNPITGDCQIGYTNNGNCTYNTLLSSPCFGFSVDFPIQTMEIKSTNCSTQVYWADPKMRFIDLDDLPFKEILDPSNDFKRIKIEGEVDCNKLLVQPNFSVPKITLVTEDSGGSLVYGTYQFITQYANSTGAAYTSYYNATNPVSIFDDKITPNFDEQTTKSITGRIENLDTSGLYDFFNLAVIETVNNIPTVKLIGTYPIIGKTFDFNYTGNTQTLVQLSYQDIFEKFPYYDRAGGVTSASNSLIWYNLSTDQEKVLQNIWSKVILQWETYKVPYTDFEGYKNAINTANVKGYMRDEPYALEGILVWANGRESVASHIPGRAANSVDHSLVDTSNLDAASVKQDPCDPIKLKQRWQVYNTATKIAFTEEYLQGGVDNDCYVGPYEYGDFGYWESQEKYPNNPIIWGELAGKPIRHHKFPDVLVAPIHDNNTLNNPNFVHSIYPIGIRIVADSLYKAVQESDLTDEEKSQIVGFKIVRGNRASNNKSVIAKGMFYNVGKYTRDNEEFYYPNYPYNDVQPDPFISSQKVTYNSGSKKDTLLNGFSSNESKERYTFHSPDTHFAKPNGVDSGYIKIDSVEYGKSRSHFVEIKDNAKYKFLTRESLNVAFALGLSSVISLDTGGGFLGVAPSVSIDLGPAISVFTASLEMLKNLAQEKNYGYQFNSIGIYNNSYPIPNDEGIKIRSVETGKYLIPRFESANDLHQINNYKRESSVYFKVNSTLPFPHEISAQIPVDNSRYILSDVNACNTFTNIITRDISAYYGALKKEMPDQWGRMYSYETIDTGYYHQLIDENGRQYKRFPAVFGGDIFINRFGLKRKLPFFIDETVGERDGTDISLDDMGNVGYPIFYYSTKKIDTTIDFSNLDDEINKIVDTSFGNIALNLLSGGTGPLIAGATILSTILRAYKETLGVANVNLDCPAEMNLTEEGKAYLFAYGIPYFFVESEVNLDYRQAYNDKEGNFYPKVSNEIPDEWLQEVNVPIIQDNTYTYNKTYSKQNKENVFTHLRESYDPSKTCLFEFPNRAIYSDKSTIEETKNNWLVYRPVSFFDFPKEFGPLTALNGYENNQVLARFENKSQIYNALATIQTSTGLASLGNDQFFKAAPPLDLADTDDGFTGSQHKFFLKTIFGNVFIDSKKGHVFLLNGNKLDNLADKDADKWFQEYLPFKISQRFPTINIDNNHLNVGIHGIYDAKYKRIIITKLDYEALSTEIEHKDNKFYVGSTEISLQDETFFCNRSWTISYSFVTNSWVSFHSYRPNYYISFPTYFQSGLNADGSLWNHNTSFTKFNSYYGITHPYIIEYPFVYKFQDQLLQNVKEYTTALKYTDYYTFSEPDQPIYFNKSVIYNGQQCSGVRNLIPKPMNNLAFTGKYPKFNTDSIDIVVTKHRNFFQYNSFWDIVKDNNQPIFIKSCDLSLTDKDLNLSNLDYGKRDFTKAKIQGKNVRIRHILDNRSDIKLITNFIISPTQTVF
jgi:hypothetical protein